MSVAEEADELCQLETELVKRSLFVKGASNGIKRSLIVNGAELQIRETLHEDMFEVVEVFLQVLAGNQLGLSELGLGDKKLEISKLCIYWRWIEGHVAADC